MIYFYFCLIFLLWFSYFSVFILYLSFFIGAERFSNYTGYADTFQWSGNCDDPTPYDGSARKQTTIVAIDAIYFSKPINQFNRAYVLREVNKTYIGFHSRQPYQLPAVATGNWGCGAFRGNPHIKFLIQLMACSATNRDMVYYTFNDEKLKDTLYNMYTFIATNSITISKFLKINYCGNYILRIFTVRNR